MRKANVDADLIVYTVGSVCDGRHYEYSGEEYSTKKELSKAYPHLDVSKWELKKRPKSWEESKQILISYTEDVLEYFQDYQLFLSGKGNFRYKIATILPYKGKRVSMEKPFHYDAIRQFLVDTYDAELSSGMEADDVVGLAQTKDTVIVSTDKDLDVVPGHHYNWVTNTYYCLEEVEADRKFFKQLLTGDPTDNILGLHNVGPKSTYCKAIDKMDDVKDMYYMVFTEYKKRFGTYASQFLLENADLLWILQQRKNPVREYLS